MNETDAPDAPEGGRRSQSHRPIRRRAACDDVDDVLGVTSSATFRSRGCRSSSSRLLLLQHLGVRTLPLLLSRRRSSDCIVRPLEDILGTIQGIETLSARASVRRRHGQRRASRTAPTWTWPRSRCAIASTGCAHLLPDRLAQVRRPPLPEHRHAGPALPRDRRLAARPDAPLHEEVIQRRLERLEGVAQVRPRGWSRPRCGSTCIPSRLQAHGLDVR